MKTRHINQQYQTRKLKVLSVLFTMLLLPLGAWADYEDLPESPYNLWVTGTAVTDDNKANILGGDVVTVSYDSENNVLTLNGASLDGSTMSKGCILSGRSALTISVNGENTIASTDSCTAILAIGAGEQTLTIVKGGNDCSLAFNVSRSIRNFNSVSLTDLDWNNNYTYQYDESFSGYRLMDSNGSEASKTVEQQTVEVVSMPILSEPYDLWVGGIRVTKANASDVLSGDEAGTISFDATTSTLTFNNVDNTSFDGEDERPFIANGLGNLNIYLEGNSFVWSSTTFLAKSGDNAEDYTVTFTTDEINPGKLGIRTDTYNWYSDHAVAFENGVGWHSSGTDPEYGTYEMEIGLVTYELTFGAVTVTSENAWNIFAADEVNDGKVSFDALTNTLTLNGAEIEDMTTELLNSEFSAFTINLTGDNSLLSIQGGGLLAFTGTGTLSLDNSDGVIKGFSDVDFGDFNLLSDSSPGVHWDEELMSLRDYNDDAVGKLTLTTATVYPLWVFDEGGYRQVTADNRTNVLGDDYSSVSYDGNGTLTVKGAQIASMDYASFVVGEDIEALTVHLVGYNQIGGGDQFAFKFLGESTTLTFTTSVTIPGCMAFYGDVADGQSGSIVYQNGLALDAESYKICVPAANDSEFTYITGYTSVINEQGDDFYVYSSNESSINMASNLELVSLDNHAPTYVKLLTSEGGAMEAGLWPSYLSSPSLLAKVSLQFDWGTCENKNVTAQVRGFRQVFNENDIFWEADGNTYSEAVSLNTANADGIIEIPLTSIVNSETIQLYLTSDNAFSIVPLTVVLTTVPTYGIEVANTIVSELNAEDVLGDGTVSYNAKTNTLTLDNATIVPDVEAVGIYYTGSDDLTIMLIGTSTIQGSDGCEGIRAEGRGGLIFATNAETPGKLVYTGDVWLIDENANVEYQNDLSLSTTATGEVIGVFKSYNIWIAGNRVTAMNKENVMGDTNASVRFNPTTNTLALYNANISVEDSTAIVRSSLDNLRIELHGTSHIVFPEEGGAWASADLNGIVSQSQLANVTLLFTTDATNPGQLVWNRAMAGNFIKSFAETNYDTPLVMNDSENYIGIQTKILYGLWVGDIQVTSLNCTDVLGNGNGEVRYVSDDQTLVLDEADISDRPIKSGLDGGLKIYLIGESTLRSNSSETKNLIYSTVADVPLTFTISENNPGSIKAYNTDGNNWFTGFSSVEVPTGYQKEEDGNWLVIAPVTPINPIVNDDPETPSVVTVEMEDPWDDKSYVSGNVLYTNLNGKFDDGDDADPTDKPGIQIGTPLETDVMDQVVTLIPGSDAFNALFTGLTIEVPAGEGNVFFAAELASNTRFCVQIGDSEPVVFPNEHFPQLTMEDTVKVAYSCPVPTYVYFYIPATPSTSRAAGVIRGRVLSGHIKINNVGASPSSIVSTNAYSAQTNTIQPKVTVYSLPANALSSDGRGVNLSTVEVQPINAFSFSRQFRESGDDDTKKKITDLSPSLFDTLDKSQILYIDLSGTDVKDFTVSRSGGVMEGFTNNVVIYLPANNDDGGEDNVVIDGICNKLTLDDALDFRAPLDFHAIQASMLRTFVPGQTSTLFLPFGLTSAQAASFGQFHRFKEIKGSDAVFHEAEAGDLSANAPFIFVPKVSSIEASDVDVKGWEDFLATSENMTGTYEKLTWDTDQTDIYGFAAAAEGDVSPGQFVRVNAGAWIPPFRAFLHTPASSARLRVVIGEGTATAIVDNATTFGTDSDWHTLDGRRLSTKPAKEGLYINKGQKVIVR